MPGDHQLFTRFVKNITNNTAPQLPSHNSGISSAQMTLKIPFLANSSHPICLNSSKYLSSHSILAGDINSWLHNPMTTVHSPTSLCATT
jgi:hypothetical protein